MREPIYKTRPVEPNPATFGAEQVNDFIVLCEAFSNNYLIMTDAGNVQINAGMAIEAPVIRQNFAAFSTKPTSHLILTQGHVDHVGGVAYLREHHPGVSVIAQAGNPEHQAYDGRLASFRANRSAFAFTKKFAAAFENYAEHGFTEFPPQDVPLPDVLVDEHLHLTVGGLKMEVIAVPGAETNDSLIVWLPEQRICFTGNLFGCPFGHFPNLVTIRGDRYRDALTVAAAVERVRALKPDIILYGHHSPVVGADLIERELAALHGAICYVHAETVRGMNAGTDVHTLMRTIKLPPEFEVGQGYGKVSWGVRAIWENYAGWFHHRSTTELYSEPVASIHSDLIELAGGPQALVQRAQDKIAQGHPEQALHLLDIAMSEDDASAREVAAQVHRVLLADSQNFWLSAWLSHKIEALDS